MNLGETSIILVARCKYDKQTTVFPHYHEFYQIIYVASGDGTLGINHIFSKSIEDDVYIIKPGISHELVSNPSNPLRTIEIKFSSEDDAFISRLEKFPVIFNNKNMKVKLIFENLVEEAINNKCCNKEIITVNLYEAVFLMVRVQLEKCLPLKETSEDYQIVETTAYDRMDHEILQFIHDNYMNKVSLMHLAKILAINQSQLCKIFIKKHGITPVQYINNLRLLKAKELLTYSDMNITEISENIGFQSIHYFSRYFTSRMNISPIEYRHRIKECIYINVENEFYDVSLPVSV